MRKPKQKVFSSIVIASFNETSPFVFEFCRQQQKNPEAFSFERYGDDEEYFKFMVMIYRLYAWF